LYRQHQRIQQSGITISRSTLTKLVKRAIDLLRPIVDAQTDNVPRSRYWPSTKRSSRPATRAGQAPKKAR
jgi:hypothetical protein|tara:strand:- start:1191 stop:1400 length:210 start_codon:yes stop_codon:yes gene_type:complete